jgi:hypothetical protein
VATGWSSAGTLPTSSASSCRTPGRIVVLESNFTVRRFNANGSLDTAFAEGNFGAVANAKALAASGTDKVVAFGNHALQNTDDEDWGLMRVLAGAVSAGDLIAGQVSDANDTVVMRRNGNNVDIWVNKATSLTPTFQVPLLEMADQFVNTLGGNDTLVFDYTNGNTFPTTGGITFEDGDGNDTLQWIGSASAETIALFSNLLVIPSGDVVHTYPENITIDLAGGNDTITIETSPP